MPMDINAEDDGYFILRVRVAGQEQPVEIKLDLYEAHNAAATIADKFPGDTQPVEQGEAWVEWLTSKGVPPLSHGAACAVAGRIREAMVAFKKKHALDLDLPDSDASTTCPSTPEASPN